MDLITVKYNQRFDKEKEYILNFILGEITDCKINYRKTDKPLYQIIFANDHKITIEDHFFKESENLLEECQIPTDFVAKDIKKYRPQIAGKYNFELTEIISFFGNGRIVISDKEIYLGSDLFASAFYLLSRMEEIIITKRDNFDRFDDYLNTLTKFNLNKRPLVDEYLYFFRKFFEILGVGSLVKQRKAEKFLTFDIDEYKKYYRFNLIKRLAGDLLRRKSFSLFKKTLIEFLKVKLNKIKDPYDKFAYFKELARALEFKSIYFVLVANETKYEGKYSLKDRKLISFLKELKKDNLLGLHYGFNSSGKSLALKEEQELLEKVTKRKITKGRSHFLRFRIETLYENLLANGFSVDYSMGFSKFMGFRAGTSLRYPPFNFKKRAAYELEVFPFSLMDTPYLNLLNSGKISFDLFQKELEELLINLKKVNGNYCFLLHNSSVSDSLDEFLKRKFLEI